MTGKQKCEILKKIRRDIAKANDIAIDMRECTHKGECTGTCPKCEAEVKTLEKGLALRKKRGFKIAVAGISAGLVALNSTACDALDALMRQSIQGDMMPPESEYFATAGDLPLPETEEFTSTAGEIVLDGEIAVPETEEIHATPGLLPFPETEEVVLEGDLPPEGIN